MLTFSSRPTEAGPVGLQRASNGSPSPSTQGGQSHAESGKSHCGLGRHCVWALLEQPTQHTMPTPPAASRQCMQVTCQRSIGSVRRAQPASAISSGVSLTGSRRGSAPAPQRREGSCVTLQHDSSVCCCVAGWRRDVICDTACSNSQRAMGMSYSWHSMRNCRHEQCCVDLRKTPISQSVMTADGSPAL